MTATEAEGSEPVTHAPGAFTLERWFAEFEFIDGMRVLSASGASSPSIREVLALESDGASEGLLDMALDYIENPGGAGLRRAIARLYTSMTAEDVRVTTGASEAILLLLWSELSHGDNVVVEDPCYQSHAEVASSMGAEVRVLPLDADGGWLPDPDCLARLIDARTRFVFINHPHNPTGSVLDHNHLEALVRVVERSGATLVSDEVFRPIALESSPTQSAADLSDRVVSIGDLSKPWGLAGLRVGWIAGHDRALLRRISETRDFTTMCCAGPSEFLAEIALQHSAAVLGPRLETARANLGALRDVVNAEPGRLRWVAPGGGYSAFVEISAIADTEPWCRMLATRHRVLLLPGHVFGEQFRRYVRIGFGGPADVFRAGLKVIRENLSV